MNILSRLFSKSPADLLAKGDRFFDSDQFFDARNCYEEGLQRCSGDLQPVDQKAIFTERIERANFKLAELNLTEAGFAFSRGDSAKAVDHLELVNTLTHNPGLREKAENLLKKHSDSGDEHPEPASSSCSSCSHIQVDDYAESQYADDTIHPLEYFELLIRQLPQDQYLRYSELGEDFAFAYVSACQDRHEEALALFDKWFGESDRDVYFCERGKILHRLGNDLEAEQHLRTAIQLNPLNPLAWLNLSLLLIEGGRFDEAMTTLDRMISEDMMAGQAMLMRGEVLEAAGNLDEAVDQYSGLLTTALAKSAAERLHAVLVRVGRDADAATVFKRFLGGCSH